MKTILLAAIAVLSLGSVANAEQWYDFNGNQVTTGNHKGTNAAVKMAGAQCEMYANQKTTNFIVIEHNTTGDCGLFCASSQAELDAYYWQNYSVCMKSRGYEYR